MYPKGQPSTDQSRSKVGADHPCYHDEVPQQLYKIEIIMDGTQKRSSESET